ncbi:MAG TPA: alpha/beta hydrolase [Verrucomicrobiae bacterium]|nr:alpha/beta hydrolase [Verrucomicrobiae bacterium]
MVLRFFDRFWHRALGRPYYLARTIDEGEGPPVVLLHGIGRTGEVWRHVVEQLQTKSYRVVAFDLLGFGASPKPEWLRYTVDDHVTAVIASLERLKLREPVILVGHSMGCLVAVRMAHLRPDLVKHLVLYEMPLYEGLPQKRLYRVRLNLYFRFYNRLIRLQPTFSPENARLAERLAPRIVGFEVTEDTWQPFVKSLENTIMSQTAAEDIKQLAMPMDVIYGMFDMLVIRGKPTTIFGVDNANITAHTIRARHMISPKASRFLVSRIVAASQEEVMNGN